jgi:dephospho-CoA kinase
MLTFKRVAVTGGLSCGKTSACGFFKELGAHVVSADEIVHQLLSPNTSLGQQVVTLLGENILFNGQIDRNKVAKIVFNDPLLLQAVQKILHPAVMMEIEKQYQNLKGKDNDSLFVAEIPLLFEIGGEKFFDFTIAVIADLKIALNRFKVLTGYQNDEYEKRMKSQFPLEEKIKRSDYVINNSGSLNELRDCVIQVYNKLTQNQF